MEPQLRESEHGGCHVMVMHPENEWQFEMDSKNQNDGKFVPKLGIKAKQRSGNTDDEHLRYHYGEQVKVLKQNAKMRDNSINLFQGSQ